MPRKKNNNPCIKCGEKKRIEGRGLCKQCYWLEWKKNRKPKMKQGKVKQWTEEELEYISNFCEAEDAEGLALGLDRSETSIRSKLQYLRRTGEIEYYKQSYERKLNT